MALEFKKSLPSAQGVAGSGKYVPVLLELAQEKDHWGEWAVILEGRSDIMSARASGMKHRRLAVPDGFNFEFASRTEPHRAPEPYEEDFPKEQWGVLYARCMGVRDAESVAVEDQAALQAELAAAVAAADEAGDVSPAGDFDPEDLPPVVEPGEADPDALPAEYSGGDYVGGDAMSPVVQEAEAAAAFTEAERAAAGIGSNGAGQVVNVAGQALPVEKDFRPDGGQDIPLGAGMDAGWRSPVSPENA